MNPKVAKGIIMQRGQYNLGNNFVYGLDSQGGISARNVPIKEGDISKCLDDSKIVHAVRVDNK
jgi:hypothetical protein